MKRFLVISLNFLLIVGLGLALASCVSRDVVDAVSGATIEVGRLAGTRTIPVLTPMTGGSVRMLSHYVPSLAGSPGDTAVYILDSGNPGGNLLIVGGTHGNEPSGIGAAIRIIENAHVERGRVIVIPHLNVLGYLYDVRHVPLQYHGIPDPEFYIPPGGETMFPGIEQRNPNRAYPGSDTMGLTQRVALGVMNLIYSENIDVAIDLHEAGPSSDLAWMIISNPKNVGVAAFAVIDLEFEDIFMRLDISSAADGLSHWECGNNTQALAFLIETANPYQDREPELFLGNPDYDMERRIRIQLESVWYLVANSNDVLSQPIIYSLR